MGKEEKFDPGFVREYFDYDPETGDLIWKKRRGKYGRVGAVAGCQTKAGRIVGFGGKLFQAGRLVWVWHHWVWPSGSVRYSDRNPCNTRIENLMVCGKKTGGASVQRKKHNYKSLQEIPISVVKEYFRLNEYGILFWKKRRSPNTNLNKPAGTFFNGMQMVMFFGFRVDANIIAKALRDEEWEKVLKAA